jgi:hypothetical protein
MRLPDLGCQIRARWERVRGCPNGEVYEFLLLPGFLM